MDSKLSYRLETYYSIKAIRVIINLFYILNEILLTVYLLFIPIQIAYFWLLVDVKEGSLQNYIDSSVLLFFLVHVGLYFDEKLFQWMKSPYLKWYQKLITAQLIYDIICVLLAIVLVFVPNTSVLQRRIQILFLGKIYKVVKLDIKSMNIVIGTSFYFVYKIIRTLLILAMVISYVGSMFYGIAYILYKQGIADEFLLWIVYTPAISECVTKPFDIQLEYAMYWALGTASTAAYGDISAAEPRLIILNIFALAFQGFLFGFYLNSMHSIPTENKQKQEDLIQKFQAFQQHSSNRKINKKLYFQILCSLQYTESQNKKIYQIEKFLPKKYIQEIKFNVYNGILKDSLFFGTTEFQMEITEKVQESVSQMGEDVYNYRNIQKDDLLFLKEGKISYFLDGEAKIPTKQVVTEGNYLGLYQFMTGLLIPHQAICIDYCFLYRISRDNYKKALPSNLKLQFSKLQNTAFRFEGTYLSKQPIVKLVKKIGQSQSIFLFFNQDKKQKEALKIMNQQKKRLKVRRGYKRSHKITLVEKGLKKKKNASTQTEEQQFILGEQFQSVYFWSETKTQFPNYRVYNFL